LKFAIRSLTNDNWQVGFCRPGELDAWRTRWLHPFWPFAAPAGAGYDEGLPARRADDPTRWSNVGVDGPLRHLGAEVLVGNPSEQGVIHERDYDGRRHCPSLLWPCWRRRALQVDAIGARTRVLCALAIAQNANSVHQAASVG